MNLELKHLSPYLPYKLQIYNRAGIHEMVYTSEYYRGLVKKKVSPVSLSVVIENNYSIILRPISDLNKEIEFKGRKFYPIDELAEIDEVVVLQYSFEFFETSMKYLPHWIVEQLLEWHFDVFGLIEKGLAISIHDVEQADA